MADDEPHDIAWDIQEQMKQVLIVAVSNTPVQIDLLGHYCSTVLTNPTVVAHSEIDERFSIGLEFLPDITAKLVDKLLCLLADQLNKDQICKISKDRILDIGAVVNQIWDAIAESKYW